MIQPNKIGGLKDQVMEQEVNLSLITGDHPQAFANHVILVNNVVQAKPFGYQTKIGYVSGQLHLDYRVNCSVLM